MVTGPRDQWAAVFTHSVIVLAGPSVFPPQTSHRVQIYQKFAWNLKVDETVRFQESFLSKNSWERRYTESQKTRHGPPENRTKIQVGVNSTKGQ